MWWPYVPWLAFLIVVLGTVATYQLRSHQKQRRARWCPPTEGPGERLKRR